MGEEEKKNSVQGREYHGEKLQEGKRVKRVTVLGTVLHKQIRFAT